MNLETPVSSLSTEIAEHRKERFVKLVGRLAALRDIQYDDDSGPDVVEDAQNVVALNLPSNLLRAAAIFVDYRYGFPPGRGSFLPPQWVTAKRLLPEAERGSLVCSGLKDARSISENDVVVLTSDVDEHGLHAGMAGIVKQLLGGDENNQSCLVEFGEPEDCITQEVEILASILRCPRPGDLLENYRS